LSGYCFILGGGKRTFNLDFKLDAKIHRILTGRSETGQWLVLHLPSFLCSNVCSTILLRGQ